MKIKVLFFPVMIAFLFAATPRAFAETRTISWEPVTTYTDNTTIETGKTILYTVYWSTDAGLSLASLRAIGSSLSQTSTTFDPDVQGMTRGSTVYFTAKAVLNTGEASALSPAYSWAVPSVTPPTPVLSGISISGPSSVDENGTGTYTSTATWDNGSTTSVAPAWSESSSYATISAGGVLTASAVTSSQAVTVTASYTSGGVTKTATKAVNIVDVATLAPASPKNLGITGPISSAGAEFWQISWDPVGTFADDTPLDPGRTVRYTAYWTEDPALSAESLLPLASSISANTFEFDPTPKQMVKNRPAYLTVRAILDNGDESSLAESLMWVVANEGPSPPAKGQIHKK
jgi:hypothetical protein